ncbi:MAG: hypothetical protein WD960_00945 [Gemmatimonadota bacterium]
MVELLQALGTGLLWAAPLAVLVILGVRTLGLRPAPALLLAWPIFFAGQVLLVHGLAKAGLLTRTPVVALYLAAAIAGGFLCLRTWGGRPASTRAPERAGDDENGLFIRRLAIAAAGAVLACTAIFALVAPVHVWDVLAYHMPMVASYFQNASLEAWPTQDLRHIYRVNAAEVQLLNLALLSGSDAWLGLPGVAALGVFLAGAFELARLALPRRAAPWVVVLLILSAPQVLVGAGTAKNDLVFSAALLAAFYWIIRAGLAGEAAREEVREEAGERFPAWAPVALAALCGALAAATKVLGLNVLGALGLLALALVWRGRLPRRAVITFGLTTLAALLLFAGDVYLSNLSRSAVPVGITPGEVQFTFGPANLVEAARFYLYELPLRRLLAPQIVEHDFLHYGYLFPLMMALGLVGMAQALRERNGVLGALTLGSAVLFASVIAARLPIRWDQRFMIWMIPVAGILAMHALRRLQDRHLIAIAGVAAGLTVANLSLLMTTESASLFPRSAMHLLKTGVPARYLDASNDRYLHMSDGFEHLDREAAPGDSVLYAGSDDSWMYLAWGPRFTRHVEGVSDPEQASGAVSSRRFRYIVLEHDAEPSIERAVLAAAQGAGYRLLVEAEGRTILLRAPEEEVLSGSVGPPARVPPTP